MKKTAQDAQDINDAYNNFARKAGLEVKEDKQCQAKTKKGTRCEKIVKKDSVFCGYHLKYFDKKDQKDQKDQQKIQKEEPPSKEEEFARSDYSLISPLYRFDPKEYDVDYYREEYVKPIISWHKDKNQPKTIMVKSPAGSGKTQCILNLFASNMNLRLGYICPQIALAEDVSGKLPRFSNYLRDKGLATADKVIVSFFSLYKVGYNAFDILVIDEIEEICAMVMSPIMMEHNWSNIAKMFMWHIQNAGQVVCLDAALSKRSYDMIKYMRDVVKLSINLCPPTEKKVFMIKYDKKIHIVADIIQSCINNKDKDKRIVFCTANADLGRIVYENAIKNGIAAIIHISDNPNSDLLKNVNESWKPFNLIIYSSMIGIGVDCNLDIYVLFAYFSANLTLRQQFQMTMRFRNVKDIHLFQNTRSYMKNFVKATLDDCLKIANVPDTVPEQILTELAKLNDRNVCSSTKLSQVYSEKVEKVKELIESTRNRDWLTIQALYNALEIMSVRNHYYEVFFIYAKLYNWKTTHYSFDGSKLELKAYSKLDKVQYFNLPNFEEIREIDTNTAGKFWLAKRNGSITWQQSKELLKYQFAKMTGYKNLSDTSKFEIEKNFRIFVENKKWRSMLTTLLDIDMQMKHTQELNAKQISELKSTFAKIGVEDPTRPTQRIRIQKFANLDQQWRQTVSSLYEIPWTEVNKKKTEYAKSISLLKKISKQYLGMSFEKLDKNYVSLVTLDNRILGFSQILTRSVPFFGT